MFQLVQNDLQMEQRLQRGAGPDREATKGEATFTCGRFLGVLAGHYSGGRVNADDSVVG